MWIFCKVKPAPNKLNDTVPMNIFQLATHHFLFSVSWTCFIELFTPRPPLTLQPTRSPSTNEMQAKPYPIDGSNLVPLTRKKQRKLLDMWFLLEAGGKIFMDFLILTIVGCEKLEVISCKISRSWNCFGWSFNRTKHGESSKIFIAEVLWLGWLRKFQVFRRKKTTCCFFSRRIHGTLINYLQIYHKNQPNVSR